MFLIAISPITQNDILFGLCHDF